MFRRPRGPTVDRMEPTRTVALTAAVVAAAVVALTGSAQAAPHGRPISLHEHDTQQASIDLGDPGPGIGDLFLFAGDVFDHHGGKKLGTARGSCTTVSGDAAAPGDLSCDLVFVLADGQIRAGGLFDTTALFGGATLPLAVTGGTGRYRDARGDGTGRVPPEVPGATDADFVLNLL